jgi:hypothetical protein
MGRRLLGTAAMAFMVFSPAGGKLGSNIVSTEARDKIPLVVRPAGQREH